MQRNILTLTSLHCSSPSKKFQGVSAWHFLSPDTATSWEFSACLFWCWCGLDLHNIQENSVGIRMIQLTIGIQPREGEVIYCIWQDPQTIFGGKEATKFATDINDKHLSFEKMHFLCKKWKKVRFCNPWPKVRFFNRNHKCLFL